MGTQGEGWGRCVVDLARFLLMTRRRSGLTSGRSGGQVNLATTLMQLLVTHGGAAWESLGMMQGSLDTGPMFNALRLKETVRSPPSFTVWMQPRPYIHACQ